MFYLFICMFKINLILSTFFAVKGIFIRFKEFFQLFIVVKKNIQFTILTILSEQKC